MREIILHIGFGKCASSSIQSLLTQNAEFMKENFHYKYIAFNQDCSLINSDLIGLFSHFPPRYLQSNISCNPSVLKKQLSALSNCKADIGIISNEGLANPGCLTSDLTKCFSDLNIPIKVFAVIRRFDTWLNSSWWQWGAFSDASVDDWLNSFSLKMFPTGLQQWLDLPNVKSFELLDLSENPVEKFAFSLGLNVDKTSKINAASTTDMMWFLVRNKYWLKREIHSPLIEFILNEEINFSGKKPPSVISNHRKKSILQQYELALETDIQEKLAMIFSSHLNDLDEELCEIDFNDDQSQSFCMREFLKYHQPSTEFLIKLNDLLAKRSQLPKDFSSAMYLYLNPDLKATGANPYQHYLEFGIKEGRRIR